MGYHDGRELANYWKYAHDFVLQDRLFEPNASWSLPQHLFMVSGWSAWCKQVGNPMSCVNELESPDFPPDFRSANPRFRPPGPGRPDYAWTDLTYLLHAHHVSWAYYVMRWKRTGLRQRPRRLRSGAAKSPHAGHMESAALLRYREA